LAASRSLRSAPRGWLRIPGNQSLQLEVNDKQLLLPRLPAAWHGLTIAHLSDLHFTGRVPREFFDEVVARTNRWQPDLIVLTGDFADRNACLEWIVPVLGELRSRHGTYFVLGNHDRRVDTRRLLRLLDEAGLIHVGGQCREVVVDLPATRASRQVEPPRADRSAPLARHAAPLQAGGVASYAPRLAAEFRCRSDGPADAATQATLLVAGNELPWFKPYPVVPPRGITGHRNQQDCAAHVGTQGAALDGGAPTLRVLLSHSPDQIEWAAAHDFDLLLCGHTHGGQICLPLVGPTVCPSRYGTRFASGVFYQPPTVMHVSRGLSGKLPLRINCRPELTRLILCSPQAMAKADVPHSTADEP
jgi:predicted MPP superfamily phosphohydrolase